MKLLEAGLAFFSGGPVAFRGQSMLIIDNMLPAHYGWQKM